MLNPRLVIALLIGLAIATDALFLGVLHSAQAMPHWSWVAMALAYSQIAMLVAWITWGRGPGTLRFVAGLALVYLLAYLLRRSGIHEQDIYFIAFSYLSICLVGTSLLQLKGWRWMLVNKLDAGDPAGSQTARPQFSVRYLFMITTLLAVVLSTIRNILGEVQVEGWRSIAGSAGKLLAPVAVAGVSATVLMWGLLAIRDLWSRLAVAALSIISLTMLASTTNRLVYHQLLDIRPTVVHLAIASVILLLLRQCGYRMVRGTEDLAPRR